MEKTMKTSYLVLAVAFLFLALFMAGCTPLQVVGKAASIVAKPVLGLAVKDAETTLQWVENELQGGRLSPVDAEAAKKCPLSVIALSELRSRMAAGVSTEDGFKGLIYYGTKSRYGEGGVQAEASRHLSDLAAACLPLIPAEKLIRVF